MPFQLLFPISVVAGLIGAASGMGGGVVIIPALTLSGIDIKEAIAITNLATIAVSVSSAVDYIRRHMPNLHVSAFLQVFALLGAWGGAFLTVVSQRRPLFFLYGGVLVASWFVFWRERRKEQTPASSQDAVSKWFGLQGAYYDYVEKRTIHYRAQRAFPAALLMLGAGIVSGALGLGASALTTLVNERVMGLPTKISLSTAQLIIAVMALAGSNVYIERGLINSQLIAPVILGVPLGALVGSRLVIRLTNEIVRVIFRTMLVLFGIEMILHGLQLAP